MDQNCLEPKDKHDAAKNKQGNPEVDTRAKTYKILTPKRVCCKIHEGTKWIAFPTVVHPRHNSTQMSKPSLLLFQRSSIIEQRLVRGSFCIRSDQRRNIPITAQNISAN